MEPGRPVVVKVSVSLKRYDPVRPSIFVLFGTPPPPPPETTQLPTPTRHKPRDAWPWGPRGRAVPGHPGQQFKHGVQHVAVTLLQFKQPERGKRAGSLTGAGRGRSPSIHSSRWGTAGPGSLHHLSTYFPQSRQPGTQLGRLAPWAGAAVVPGHRGWTGPALKGGRARLA